MELSPFFRRGSWDTEKLSSNLFKVTHPRLNRGHLVPEPLLLTTTLPPHGSASPSATSISSICWSLFFRWLVSFLVCAVNAAASFQTQDQVCRTYEMPSCALLGAWLSCVDQKSPKSQHLALSYRIPFWGHSRVWCGMGKSRLLKLGNHRQRIAETSLMSPSSSGLPKSLTMCNGHPK